jgi:rubrerythrin
MDESKSMEILKTAILLERKGKAFYSSVADKADDPDVKQFFSIWLMKRMIISGS